MQRQYKLKSKYSSSSKVIRTALRERGMWCQCCHLKWYSDIHHIDKDRTNNNLDNLLLVCRQCHIKLDRDKMSLL